MWDDQSETGPVGPPMPSLPADAPSTAEPRLGPPRESAASPKPPLLAPPPVPSTATPDPVVAGSIPTPPVRPRRTWPLLLLAILTVAASGLVSWFVASQVDDRSETAADPTTTTVVEPISDGGGTESVAATTIPAIGGSAELLQSEPFARAAAKIAPSVVQLSLDDGLGSGVIIDEDGVILTAAHVVGSNTDIRVRLFDGSTVDGTVVGTHLPTDVAVVQIDATGRDLVAAEIADGNDVQVGQLAVAVGSPFGFDQTVTAGIISGVDRVVNTVSMVQTDAPINPGNSGGPLIDLEGRVVGINDLIFTQSGTSAGVGFAISIDLAMIVAEQLVAGEDVQLALLGVSTRLSPDGSAGALIEQVVEGSAAETAGLEIGDLVVGVNGKRTRGSSDLRAQVIDFPPGTTITLDIIRAGERRTVSATLGSTG